MEGSEKFNQCLNEPQAASLLNADDHEHYFAMDVSNKTLCSKNFQGFLAKFTQFFLLNG